MKTVTMHAAKTHLSRLVDEALAGEEVIIARRNKPLVKLSVVEETHGKRHVGSLPDLVVQMDDNFNDSLDDWSDEIFPQTKS